MWVNSCRNLLNPVISQLTFTMPRIDIPVWYEDGHGERPTMGRHSMLLPHEIVGSFFRFKPVDLMRRLTGKPGVPRLYIYLHESPAGIYGDKKLTRLFGKMLPRTSRNVMKEFCLLFLRLSLSSGPTRIPLNGTNATLCFKPPCCNKVKGMLYKNIWCIHLALRNMLLNLWYLYACSGMGLNPIELWLQKFNGIKKLDLVELPSCHLCIYVWFCSTPQTQENRNLRCSVWSCLFWSAETPQPWTIAYCAMAVQANGPVKTMPMWYRYTKGMQVT